MIGKLIYLTHTRPNISFLVGKFSWHMNNPTKEYIRVARLELRYLTGIIDYGIMYTDSQTYKLERFTNSDWGGSMDDRKST